MELCIELCFSFPPHGEKKVTLFETHFTSVAAYTVIYCYVIKCQQFKGRRAAFLVGKYEKEERLIIGIAPSDGVSAIKGDDA